MRVSKGKFTLFDINGLSEWLNSQTVHRVVNLIQVHHTWCPSYSDFTGSNHFELLRSMENAHIQRGFSEIAQHFTTFPDGTIGSGRSLDRIPAGIKGANGFSICVENTGNFDMGKDIMTVKHKEAIIQINALLCRKFNLQPGTDTVIYHHWYDLTTGQRTNGSGDTKSCPGSNFFGGNRVKDAGNNFIPLVSQALQAMIYIQPEPEGNIAFSAEVTADILNVRDKPSAAGRIIKKLSRGTTVNIYEECDGWCRVHPAENHWVSGKYLETTVYQT